MLSDVPEELEFRVISYASGSLYLAICSRLGDIRKKEHRTRSELLREALRRYVSSAPTANCFDEVDETVC